MAGKNSGAIGNTQVGDETVCYYMTGSSYADTYGRFFYVYKLTTSPSWVSYNASFAKMAIRPVR